jgi:hypothetical protein
VKTSEAAPASKRAFCFVHQAVLILGPVHRQLDGRPEDRWLRVARAPKHAFHCWHWRPGVRRRYSTAWTCRSDRIEVFSIHARVARNLVLAMESCAFYPRSWEPLPSGFALFEFLACFGLDVSFAARWSRNHCVISGTQSSRSEGSR